MRKENILGFNINIDKIEKIINEINKKIKDQKKCSILNISDKLIYEHYGKVRSKNIFNNFDIQICSSKLVKYISFVKHIPIELISEEKICNSLFSLSLKEGYKVALITKSEFSSQIRKYIKNNYKGIMMKVIPGNKKTIDVIINEINQYKPDIILCGDTDDAQNDIIFQYTNNFKASIIMSINEFFRKICNNTKNNNRFDYKYKILLKVVLNKIKNKCIKKTDKKGFVVGWYYLPQTTAQALSTFKILKNSFYNYDVFTSKNQYFCYNTKTDLEIFNRGNIKTIYSENLDINSWCSEAAKYFIENKNNYDFLMTRTMPSWSHDIGIEVKKIDPSVKWIASFGDPMFNSPYVMSNIAYDNFSKKKAEKILNNYKNIFSNSKCDDYKAFIPLIEEKNKIMQVFESADLLVFNNIYQIKWMLGEDYNKYKHKCYVLPHSFDPEFYFYTRSRINYNEIKFLFLGHTDRYRNLNSLVEALNLLKKEKPKYLDKVKFILVGDIFNQTKKLINKYKLNECFVYKDNVNYLESLDLMSKVDVLVHSDAKFEFMDDLNIYFASKLSDYIGSKKLILSLSTRNGITHDVIECTNNLFCEISDIKNIKNTILNIVNGKYNNKKAKKYKNFNSKYVVKKFDRKVKKILRSK